MAEPSESEKTTLSKQVSPPPVKVTSTNIPSPGGRVAPVRLNPITVEEEVETIKPCSCARPPEAPVMVIPEISNWKPAMGVSLIKYTSRLPSLTAPKERALIPPPPSV